MADPNKKQATGPEGMTATKQATPVSQDQGKGTQDQAKDTAMPTPAEAKPLPYPVGWLGYIDLSLLEIGDIALRPAQTESDEFKGLFATIEKEGFNQNILIKPSEQTPGKYMLVDGLQRTTIAQMQGLKTVPAMVVNADESKQHSLQIQMNLHRVTTKPAQFGASIRRMMALNPALTVVDLASELNVSTTYIIERINLKKLVPEIADKVDAGEITATAAFKLAKLPQDEQVNFVSRAVSLPLDQFTDQVEARVTEINTAKREGRTAEEEKFVAIPRLRKKNEFETEHDSHAARAELVTPTMTAQEAFDAAIAWGLQLDPASIEAEREKWEAEKKARDERIKAREAAREAAKKDKGSKAEDAAAAALAQ